jgi:hypothetical protein
VVSVFFRLGAILALGGWWLEIAPVAVLRLFSPRCWGGGFSQFGTTAAALAMESCGRGYLVGLLRKMVDGRSSEKIAGEAVCFTNGRRHGADGCCEGGPQRGVSGAVASEARRAGAGKSRGG